MYKMKKKGFLASWIVTIFVILFLLLLFLIFYILFKIEKATIENQIIKEKVENKLQIDFLNFLRIPINDKENIQDYLGYAVLEETTEEKQKTEMMDEVPASYSYFMDLFYKNIVEFYKPDCVFLKLEIMDSSGKVARTRYLGQCDTNDYSANIILPLKQYGSLLNATIFSGTASGMSGLKFCLSRPLDVWKCNVYYEATGSLGGVSCEGVVFDDSLKCIMAAEKINKRADAATISIGEVMVEIEKTSPSVTGWVLCEYFDDYYYQCSCSEITSNIQACGIGYTQIGDPVYASKEECEKGIETIAQKSIDDEDFNLHCYAQALELLS
jgi:hypothetical protein